MLFMRFADAQWPVPLSLLLHFAAQHKFILIIYMAFNVVPVALLFLDLLWTQLVAE